MATASSSTGDVPVIVRVKRKAFQSSLDAFWLEINERPFKRPLLDFEKLSISDSSASRVVEEINARKILVRHVETVSNSEETLDVLCSFMPSSSDALKAKIKDKEGRHSIKTVNKQDQLLVKAKQKQEVGEQDLDDYKMMADASSKRCPPHCCEEIENDIHHSVSKKASSDGYVYDLYAVEDADEAETQEVVGLPLVQVEDDDFYYGPDDSDYETDDSNAENNPLNEETSEEDDDEKSDTESEISGDSSEAGSHQSLDLGPHYWSHGEDDSFEELYGDKGGASIWRW